MKLFDLFEARRNKNHPAQQLDRIPGGDVGKSSKSNMELLEKYKDRDDVYISFTDLPKAGLNPNSNYETPIGVYCYPLKYYYDRTIEKYGYADITNIKHMSITQVIPYAGDRSFLYVLESKESLKDVADYSEEDWQRDFKKMKSILGPDRAEQIHTRSMDNSYFNTNTKDKPIMNLWGCLEFIGYYSNFSRDEENDSYGDITDFLKSKSVTVRKSVFLKMLGYKGFSDKQGLSVIHGNEPVQAFFLSSSDFNVVDRIILSKNRTHQYYSKMKTNATPPRDVYLMIKKLRKLGNDPDKIVELISKFDSAKILRYIPNDLKTYELIKQLCDKFGVYTIQHSIGKISPSTQIELFEKDPKILMSLMWPSTMTPEIKNNLYKIKDRKTLEMWLTVFTSDGVEFSGAEQIKIIKDDISRFTCFPPGHRTVDMLKYVITHAENPIERNTYVKMITNREHIIDFEYWLVDNYFETIKGGNFAMSSQHYAYEKYPKKYVETVPVEKMPYTISDKLKNKK